MFTKQILWLLSIAAVVTNVLAEAQQLPPSLVVPPRRPGRRQATGETLQVQCLQAPPDYDPETFILEVLENCNTAIDYLRGFPSDEYLLIAKETGQANAESIYQTFFISGNCALTPYLRQGAASATLNKWDAVDRAHDVLSNCGYFGYFDYADSIGVAIMVGSDALAEAQAKGLPTYPPEVPPGPTIPQNLRPVASVSPSSGFSSSR